jgi:hypothetical protein
VSIATSDATVRASVGDGATLPAGDLKVAALNNTKQVAKTTGIAVGYVALGANVAESVSSSVTEAWLGAGVVTTNERTGAVSVIASGVDDNTAEAISGAGGMFAGNAATATTRDTATTKAWLTGSGTRTTLYGGDFLVNASHQDRSGRSVTSVNASVAGASGAVALHEANSTVVASLGDNLTINALGVAEVETSNTFTEDRATPRRAPLAASSAARLPSAGPRWPAPLPHCLATTSKSTLAPTPSTTPVASRQRRPLGPRPMTK